jgi:hypothetical protein
MSPDSRDTMPDSGQTGRNLAGEAGSVLDLARTAGPPASGQLPGSGRFVPDSGKDRRNLYMPNIKKNIFILIFFIL